jgi:hypothetical protein
MREFDLEDHSYRAGDLDPRVALHVARRILPILVGLGVVVGKDGKPALKNPFAAMAPAVDIYSKMSNEDVDFINDSCLAVVQVKQGKGWAPVTRDGARMFDFIDIGVELKIVWEVGRANVGPFLRAFQSLGWTPTAVDLEA